MGSPKKWLRGDIHTMGVKMAKNWVAPLIDSPLEGLHPVFNAEEIDDLGEKIFSIESKTLVMPNPTKTAIAAVI